jgi:hypothetical protein
MQRGKPLAFLYKLGIFLFVDSLFLITSNGELRRNRPPRSGETSRSDSRDLVASGVKCGPHGGKKSKMRSSIGAGAG